MNNGVVFYESFYQAINQLEGLQRLDAYEAIVRYGLYGEVPELPGQIMALFVLIKPVIDASQRRHRAAVENGSKGGSTKKDGKSKPKKPRRTATQMDSLEDSDAHEEEPLCEESWQSLMEDEDYA